MAEFRMPSLGADMDSATLTEWMVKPGEAVKRGDVVASVETAKGIIDIEIFEPGVIEALLVEPGTEVAVGGVLATYTAQRTAATEPAAGPAAIGAPPAEASAAAAMRAVEPRSWTTRPEPAAPSRRRVSPAARRRAQELGVDLAGVPPTGAGGAVTVEDVERAHSRERVPAAAPPAQPAAPADMRSIIAQAMSRSKREIPHYYLATTIDMTRALGWLEEWNTQHAVTERLLYGVLLIKAVARALEKIPELNGFWLDGRFAASDRINVGVAISLRQGGLIAPGIDDANRKPLSDLMREFQGLVQRARGGRLRRTEITNATITVSSLGEGSVETVYPIIYPPQVAIVGFGAIVERPWCARGELTSAPLVTATLSADHRVSDGHRGSLFLTEIDKSLQQPERL